MKKIIFGKPNLYTYLIGFLFSVILTVLAFVLVQLHVSTGHNLLTHDVLIPTLLFFAFSQLIIQLIFFLHVLHEEKPKWNFVFFIGTFLLILMIIIASIWIMNNLNYRMMPESMTKFIIHDEGIKVYENH